MRLRLVWWMSECRLFELCKSRASTTYVGIGRATGMEASLRLPLVALDLIANVMYHQLYMCAHLCLCVWVLRLPGSAGSAMMRALYSASLTIRRVPVDS